MSSIIGTNAVVQVGFLVRDIEVTKRKFAEFLGVPVPENVSAGEYADTHTVYHGQPAKEAANTMAFFHVGENLQIELIEPGPGPSTWREFLDLNGEGVHHIAFDVPNMGQAIQSCKDFGMSLEQTGEFAGGGGRYAYMDATKDLKIVLELLEND
jgi:catechol 2,3-dioxygenase-like lactoylglutathione lyase family enzyme